MRDGDDDMMTRSETPAERPQFLDTQAAWIFAGGAAAVLAVFVAAGLAINGDPQGLDERLLMAMRSSADPSVPGGPHWLVGYMRDVTALGGFAVLSTLVLGVTGYLLAAGYKRHALRIFAITLTGWLASHAIKFFVQRPRPDLVPHGAEVYASSFPSGHAMTSAVVYLTLASALARTSDNRVVKIYLLALAALVIIAVGASRVFLAVHWPTDVLGGWMLGAAWVGVAWSAMRAIDYRSQLAAKI